MQFSKNIVSILLVILLMGTGLPVFHSVDLSRDGRTDLQDVILSVKDLAQSAEDAGKLNQNFKQVVTTITAVAGLKTVIKKTSDTNSANSIQTLDTPYLKYSNQHVVLTVSWSKVEDNLSSYNSINYRPVLPPPQIS